MLIQEIMSLANWLREAETNFSLLAKYKALDAVLKQNLQLINGRNNNQRNGASFVSYKNEKDDLTSAVESISLSRLSDNQISCLKVTGTDECFDVDVAEGLRELFRNEGHDYQHLSSEISKLSNALNDGRSKIFEMESKIRPYYDATAETTYLKECARLSLIFKENVSIESLDDLERSSKEWKHIIHGIGKAFDIAPTEFKILGARNGSFILDLYLTAGAMVPIGFILLRSFNLLEQLALSLKRISAIYECDIDDVIFEDLEDDITAMSDKYFKRVKKVGAKDIAKGVLKEFSGGEDLDPEKVSFLEKSIQKIFVHLKNGGELDIFDPSAKDVEDEQEGDDDPQATLRSKSLNAISEFRRKKLKNPEKLIKLLEHFDFDDEDDAEASE